jgi:ribosome-associated protein
MGRDESETKSKTQQKREHQALQALAESLSGLSSNQLDHIPLSAALRDAVEEAAGLKRGAFRRQVRYLAGLLALEDSEAVAAALERLRHGSREETARLHRIERWRERLISEGKDTLAEFMDSYPDADRQRLGQLTRAARRERDRDSSPRAGRLLFAFLREYVA